MKTERLLLMLRVMLACTCCACCVGLTSCITQVTTPIELDFNENLVIQGYAVAGEPIRDIQISRTVPPLDTFRLENAFVGDAEASITVDNRTIPLRLQAPNANDTSRARNAARSLYAPAEPLVAQSGKTYRLAVRWKGKTAQAVTTVPQPPVVQEPQLRVIMQPRGRTMATVATLTLAVQPKEREAYRIGRLLAVDTVNTKQFEAYNAFKSNFDGTEIPTTLTDLVRLRVDATILLPFPSISSIAAQVRVEALDKAYFLFAQTQGRSRAGAQNTSGLNPLGNVEGGLGVFIGMAITEMTARQSARN
jgi:hypothetical protein